MTTSSKKPSRLRKIADSIGWTTAAPEPKLDSPTPIKPRISIDRLVLGQSVVDSVTGIQGTISHFWIGPEYQILYGVRPFGKDPKSKGFVENFWAGSWRIRSIPGNPALEWIRNEKLVPTEILKTEVRHEPTSITGIVTGITLYNSGCCHADIQQAGQQENLMKFEVVNIDVRELTGPAFKPQSMTDIEADKLAKPSPGPMAPHERS